MRVLVLGGTRFIGPPAVRRIVAAGHEVTLFHRGPSHPQLPSDVRCVHGDRQALAAVSAELLAVRPELVLDMRPVDGAGSDYAAEDAVLAALG